MTNIKYPLGTILIRSINDDYGVVTNVIDSTKPPIYTVHWSKRSDLGINEWNYREHELDKWYKRV